MLKFTADGKPDFSIPPPPIPINGVRAVPVLNQFPRFSGPLHNQQYSQYLQPQGHINNHPNLLGNSSFHQAGHGGIRHNNGGGHFPPPNRPIQQQARQQINFGSDSMFDTGFTDVLNHSFPFCNPQQQNSNKVQAQPLVNQRGKGFQNNRDRRGSRGRGKFCNNNNNNNNQRNQGQAKKKKEKLDKRDLPENNVFYCDICDRGFKTKEKYREHVDNHQKCSYKDCPFVAAPKLVQLHMNLQHRSGLAKKVWSMESEEDIKKWKEDRKRNYPTAANVQRKKELQAERIKRGQVLETKDFGKMRRGQNRDYDHNNRGRGHGRRNRGRRRHHSRNTQESKQENDDDDDGPPVEMKIIRSSSHTEDEHSDSTGSKLSDPSESAETTKAGIQTKKDHTESEEKTLSNVTSLSLLAGYGTSSSDDDSADEENTTSGTSHPSNSSLPQASGVVNENDKVVNVNAKHEDRKATVLPLPQAFTRDKDSQSTLSTNTQPSPLPPRRASSPESTNSSPSSSPVAFEKDPFNLYNGDSEGILSHQDQETGHQATSISSTKSKSQNTDHQKPTAVISGDDKDVLKSDNDKSFDNPLVEDSIIHQEVESSSSSSPSSLSDSLAKKSSNSMNSPKLQDKRMGTKRGHSEHSKDTNKKNCKRESTDIKRRRLDHRPKPKQYTLLEKLLAPQIRRERNKILQCVYFIVKHKFFDEDSKKISEA